MHIFFDKEWLSGSVPFEVLEQGRIDLLHTD
jgi:hypothetical protein